jgi:hypothetical protein
MSENRADQPLDASDLALLGDLADLYETVDPVPVGLTERLSFSLALDEVYAEVAEMSRVTADLTGVRSEQADVRTQTMSFSAESLTIMVTVTHTGPDRVRLDGWVAPAAPLPVRLRMPEGRYQTVADDAGRFSFTDLPDGFVQLAFGAGPGDDEGGQVVVTPSFEL